jgi:hypothetical protein
VGTQVDEPSVDGSTSSFILLNMNDESRKEATRNIEIYSSSFYFILEDLAKAGPESDFWKQTRASYHKVEWEELLREGKFSGIFDEDAK